MRRPNVSMLAIIAMGVALLALGVFSVVSAYQGHQEIDDLRQHDDLADAYGRALADLDRLDALGNRFMLARSHDDYVEFGQRIDDAVVQLNAVARLGGASDRALVSSVIANLMPQARVAYDYFGSVDRHEPYAGPLPDESVVSEVRSRFVAAAAANAKATDAAFRAHESSQRWRSAATIGTDVAALGLVLALAIMMRRNYLKETRRMARDRQAERAARASIELSEAKLQQASELASLAYWELKAPFGEVENSARMEEFFGLPERAAVADMLGRIDQNDRPAVREAFERSLDSSEPFRVECNVTSSDGTRRVLRMYAEVTNDADGAPAAIFGAAQDITEIDRAQRRLIESRAQLKALFDGSSDVLVLVDLEFRVIAFNEAAARYARAFANVELADGMFIGDAFAATFGEDAVRRAAAALSGERVTLERELKDLSGANHWFEVSYIPVRPDQGALLGMALTVRDITERRIVEAQLLHAQKMESVGLLAGGVAHDFNNLLTAMIGYCELASAGVDDPAQARADIAEAVTAAKKAAGLTRQLLIFARQMPADAQDFDLNVLVSDLEKMLGRLIGEQVELACALAPEQLVAHLDRGQFEQVLVNLVVNARDAMSDGGRLTIETHAVWLDEEYCSSHLGVAPGQYALVAVTDNGSGIPAEVLPHIFDPFFTTKEQGKGTGLGLATCYGIVKEAGGHIAVYSEPGRGTTFKVYFPLRAVGAWKPDFAAEEPTAASGSGIVLLVEDQDEVRTLCERVLVSLGYTVIAAPDPLRAIDLASMRPDIDLVVSDVVMPGMDGVALAGMLRGILGPTPVLLMSGYAEESVLAGVAALGNVTFVSKPITPRSLAAKVAEILAGQARRGDAPAA